MHRGQQREGSADDRKAKYGNQFWLGRIDAVVINAGYGLFGAVEEFIDEQVRHQLATAAGTDARQPLAMVATITKLTRCTFLPSLLSWVATREEPS
ncbi:hypothetical protein [Amycolatopsis saalfeldensis]|uniref:Uncharacterized protein n=1 Tax=Amycolatopsis saalfeldensis TaxID=394193 RepID=A0A1H8REM2_9PSEU|nr:hypothetical protein [Amycolatopsis saalfeldensis]SEO64594.1 hypothetical protein SAMN04489732_101751 [Amycolatopsis saalfeldensis]